MIFIILLNFVIFLLLLSARFNPNGNITYLQTSIIVFTYVAVLIVGVFSTQTWLDVIVLNIFIALNTWWICGTFAYASEKYNYSYFETSILSNYISEQDVKIILPFCHHDFSKVTLNPKFVAKYYQLEKLKSKTKPKFSNFIIRTFLQEYFYFKSVYSFYLVKREKHRKDC